MRIRQFEFRRPCFQQCAVTLCYTEYRSRHAQEYRAGAAKFKATRRLNDAHQIEEVGERLRGMMPWIKSNALVDKTKN